MCIFWFILRKVLKLPFVLMNIYLSSFFFFLLIIKSKSPLFVIQNWIVLFSSSNIILRNAFIQCMHIFDVWKHTKKKKLFFSVIYSETVFKTIIIIPEHMQMFLIILHDIWLEYKGNVLFKNVLNILYNGRSMIFGMNDLCCSFVCFYR